MKFYPQNPDLSFPIVTVRAIQYFNRYNRLPLDKLALVLYQYSKSKPVMSAYPLPLDFIYIDSAYPIVSH